MVSLPPSFGKQIHMYVYIHKICLFFRETCGSATLFDIPQVVYRGGECAVVEFDLEMKIQEKASKNKAK